MTLVNKMREPIGIRLGTPGDLSFLREMLFEAAHWRPDQPRPTMEEGLSKPDLVYLLDGWGRKGDTAFIAFTPKDPQLGAAWYRFWGAEKHSYGYVAPDIPEIGIGVLKSFRGRGVGHHLITALLKEAASQGIEKVSLSVAVDNPAWRLYRSHGFKIVKQQENSWTMVAQLKPEDRSCY